MGEGVVAKVAREKVAPRVAPLLKEMEAVDDAVAPVVEDLEDRQLRNVAAKYFPYHIFKLI